MRLHVHVAVKDLAASIRFYEALFATAPSVRKDDYAKWMLDDPKVNFAISQRAGTAAGIEHLGIQVETPDELAEVYTRVAATDAAAVEEGATTCCYAKSEKSWVSDPQGVVWETFLTTGESTVYGNSIDLEDLREAACCTPETEQGVCCAPKPELAADAPYCGERAA